MLRSYLPIGLKGRLPLTEPESWRMRDAPYSDMLPFAGSNTNKSNNSTNSKANSIPQRYYKVTLLTPKPNSTVKREPLVLSWTMEKSTSAEVLLSLIHI